LINKGINKDDIENNEIIAELIKEEEETKMTLN